MRRAGVTSRGVFVSVPNYAGRFIRPAAASSGAAAQLGSRAAVLHRSDGGRRSARLSHGRTSLRSRNFLSVLPPCSFSYLFVRVGQPS
jgi:hypothetical protein